MKESAVFQQEQEIERLSVQEKLFLPYEQPTYQKVFALPRRFVLDIGSNDGRKTVNRFSNTNIQKVIGLEYSSKLVEAARNSCTDNRFSFYQCDAEAESFMLRIKEIMDAENIPAFDVIHLSFVLMHLRSPAALLEQLRRLLAPDGVLMVIDVNDEQSQITPDEQNRFSQFKEFLRFDPYAGDRACGAKLPELLAKLGYQNISLECEKLAASPADVQKKQDMFEVFCTYLQEDIRLLRKQDAENMVYVQCDDWLAQNYEALHDKALSEYTAFSIGVSIIICTGV